MRGVRVCVRWHLCWMCLLRSIEDLQFQTPFLFLSCFFCSFYITYSQIPFSFSSQLLHKSRYSHPSLSLCYQYLIYIYLYIPYNRFTNNPYKFTNSSFLFLIICYCSSSYSYYRFPQSSLLYSLSSLPLPLLFYFTFLLVSSPFPFLLLPP